MAHSVEHGLLVELAAGSVDKDGTVVQVVDPVGPTPGTQCNVPVSPSCHPVVQILQTEAQTY